MKHMHDFSALYREYKEMVWRLASRYVFSKEDREDLFQEVFLNIHRSLGKFRGEAKIETWIWRIAANSAINYVKKQSRNRNLQKLLAGLRLIEEVPAPEIDELSIPLSKLNPRQRMVLLLSDLEDRTMEEIAKITGLLIGTVKSNLHRAREILKKEVMKNG